MGLFGSNRSVVLFRISLIAFSAIAIFAAAGCGPAVGDVSGVVSYKGKPLQYGSVTIYPNSGDAPAQAHIDADGKYIVKNCPTGEAKISVWCMDEVAGKKMADAIIKGRDNKKPNPGGKPKNLPPEPKSEIPVKYNDKEKAGLTVTVTSPLTEHNIELK